MHKKVLFCATVDYHFEAFHIPYLKWFKEQGWEVHVAAWGNLKLPFVDQKYNIPIQRSPFNKRNLTAYREIKRIIEKNKYKIIHCHTPMGGVLARLAARNVRKKGTKILYTAHGFHFYEGSPLRNWALYYPIEKFLSAYTDCLITINKEDYQLAVNQRFKAKMINHVHGVGVDTDIYCPAGGLHKAVLRAEHGFRDDDFLLFYAAEFNKNKNQRFLIKSLALLKDDLPNVKLLLAGDGLLLEDCKELAKQLGVETMVHFLGYRNDVEVVLKMCDVAVASSLREGLPVNIMEAMACGLPVIASKNRGHKELVQSEQNGWLINSDDVEFMSEKIKILATNEELKCKFGRISRKIIESNYSINKVLIEKCHIYSLFMEEVEEFRWVVH